MKEDNDKSGLAVGCQDKNKECGVWYNEPDDTTITTGDIDIDDDDSDVFIQPQEINFMLRPNTDKKIDFTARRRQNALDMYFLLDLSSSMKESQKELESVPEELIKVFILCRLIHHLLITN